MQFVFRLRDTNLPKFVFEDVPLFLGLIRDLFPGLECPRAVCSNFKAAVETALAEEGYVVLPAQVSCKTSYIDRKLRPSYIDRKLRPERVKPTFSKTCIVRIAISVDNLCL
jgi:hypothetical protein